MSPDKKDKNLKTGEALGDATGNEQPTDQAAAKKSLLSALQSDFTTYIKGQKLSKYSDKGNLFSDFLKYLSSSGKKDLIKKLKEIFGEDLRWEAISDWQIDENSTIERFVSMKLNDDLNRQLEIGIVQSLAKKYKNIVKTAKNKDGTNLFPNDAILAVDQCIVEKTIDSLAVLKTYIQDFESEFLPGDQKTQQIKDFLSANWMISNSDVLTSLRSNGKIEGASIDSIVTENIAKLEPTAKRVVEALVLCNVSHMIESDIKMIDETVLEFSKFFQLPVVGNIFRYFPPFNQQPQKSQYLDILKKVKIDHSDFDTMKQEILAQALLIKKFNSQLGKIFEKLILEGTLSEVEYDQLMSKLIDMRFEQKDGKSDSQIFFELIGIKDPSAIFQKKQIDEYMKDFLKKLYSSKSRNKISIKLGSDTKQSIDFSFIDRSISIQQESLDGPLNDFKFYFGNTWLLESQKLDPNKIELYLTYFKDYFTMFGKDGKTPNDKKLFIPNGEIKSNFKLNGSAVQNCDLVVLNNELKLTFADGTTKIFDKNSIEVLDNFRFKDGDDEYEFSDFKINFSQDDLGRLIYMQAGFIAFDSKPYKEKTQETTNIMQQTIDQNFRKIEEEKEISQSPKDTDSVQNNIESNNAEFLDEWKSIEGERSVDFKPGAQFFLRAADSFIKLGGGSFWIRAEISNVSDTDFSFKIYGTEYDLTGVNGSVDGHEFTMPKTADNLRLLKSNFSHTTLKFSKIENLKGFMEAVKGLDMSDYKKLKTGKDMWQSLKFDNGKVLNPEGKPVKYIGKHYIDYTDDKTPKCFDGFEVDFGEKNVTIKDINSNYKKSMDYNSFLVFYSEKQLSSYTEEEFNQNKKLIENDNEQTSPTIPWLFLSWSNIVATWKSTKDGISNKMKKADDLRTAKFYNKVVTSSAFKGMGGFLSLVSFGALKEPFKDLEIEAISELESQVWKLIKDHKDKLGRDGTVHASRISDIIKKDIFEHPKIFESNPFKALGYLLYSLETGGGAYFRGLKTYAGKGFWVKSILGSSHHEKFMNELKVKEAKVRANPTDENLLDELMRAEIWYIKRMLETDSYKAKFGAKVAVEVEVAFTNGVSKSKVLDVEKDELKKSSFSEIYGAYMNGYISNMRGANALGALGALTKNFDTEPEYNKWYGAMLIPMLTGLSFQFWDEINKKQYRNMARMNGFSLGLYIRDGSGPAKILRLIDHACKKVGIPEDKLFSASLGFKKSGDEYDMSQISSFNYGANFGKIAKSLEKWWDMFGAKIIPILNMEDINQDGNLLHDLKNYNDPTIPSEKKLTQNGYNVLQEYVESKMSETDTSTYTVDPEYYSEGGPHYKKVLFNLSSGFVKNIMFSGHGSGRMRESASYMWKEMREKIVSLSTDKNIDKQAFEFILKKFVSWVKDEYGVGSGLGHLAASLFTAKMVYSKGEHKGSRKILSNAISNHFNSGVVNPDIIQTMEAFEELIFRNMDKIEIEDKDKIAKCPLLESVFGSDYREYLSLKAFQQGHTGTLSRNEKQKNLESSKELVENLYRIPHKHTEIDLNDIEDDEDYLNSRRG